MRYLGLDLGTRSLGIAITDKTGTIARVLKVLHFKHEDYEYAKAEVIKLVSEFDVKKIVLGYPKNMNNSSGFAASRSEQFKALLEESLSIPIILIDERLSTKEAENILLYADVSREKRKKVIDGIAAQILLETYIKMEEKTSE